MTINKKFVLPGLVILILAVLIGAAWLCSALRARSFSVVYLSSQEIYVGHLHTFPKLVLKDGYILQNTQPTEEVAKTELQLFPLSGKVWAPSQIYLNRDQILYHGPLSENSDAAKAIEAKGNN